MLLICSILNCLYYISTIKTLGILIPEDKNILQLDIHDHSCPQHWLIPQANKARDLAFYRQESKLILELRGIQKFVVMNNFYHHEAGIYSPIHEYSEIRLKNETMGSSYFYHAISHAQPIDDYISVIFKSLYMIYDINSASSVELSINQPENMHKIAVLNFSGLKKQYLQFSGREDEKMVIKNTQSQNGYHEDLPVTLNIVNWDANPEYKAIVWCQDGLLDLTRCTMQQLHTKTLFNYINNENDLADCVKFIEIGDLDLVL